MTNNTRYSSIINTISWDTFFDTEQYFFITLNDTHYNYIMQNVIYTTFPKLNKSDQTLLINGMVRVLNIIYMRFATISNPMLDENIFWNQLCQNNNLDLRAILSNLLPFINDNVKDEKKHQLQKLQDLYTMKTPDGEYVYTNSQYNRCVRYRGIDSNKIYIYERPYDSTYFVQHLELLLSSICTMENKLCINWVDVLPVKMNQYKNTQLYHDTYDKLNMEEKEIYLVNSYIDVNPGLSFSDIYNVLSNHMFHEIKNIKWIIYDAIINSNASSITYIEYIETIINIEQIWKKITWAQLTNHERNIFILEWKKFLDSVDILENTILNKLYFFFCEYHVNSRELIRQSLLILTRNMDDIDNINDQDNEFMITPETTRDAKIGLAQVPIHEIYLFFFDQITAFMKTWYYYYIKIKNKPTTTKYIDHFQYNNLNIYITPKNIYNFSKSLTHYMINNDDIDAESSEYVEIPKYWTSLSTDLINMILTRILNIHNTTNGLSRNDWSTSNWFNISRYLRELYPISEPDIHTINEMIYLKIRQVLPDVIFESMIYHGLLSEFVPNENITNDAKISSIIGTQDDTKKSKHRHLQMKNMYFSGINRSDYENQCWYYLTSDTYKNLEITHKDYGIANDYKKSYFDFLTSDQIWTFTYAMNWVSQINFYHHYINNRVIFVTGSTGVGKSTQVPILLMYSQKMLDYN